MVNKKLISFDGPYKRKLTERGNFGDDDILQLIFDIKPLRDSLLGGEIDWNLPPPKKGEKAIRVGIPQISPMRYQRHKLREYLRGKNNPTKWQANCACGLLLPLVALANGIDERDAWTAQRLARGDAADFLRLIKAGMQIMEKVEGSAKPNAAALLDASAVVGLFDPEPKEASKRPSGDDDDYSAGFEGSLS